MRLIDADELMEHSGWYNLATGKSIHGVQDSKLHLGKPLTLCL